MRAGRSRIALALVGALVFVFAACGGDDEDEPVATTETTPAPRTLPDPVTTPPPETTPTDRKPDRGRDPDAEPRTLPPDEGQQGDEEPIRSEAVFTGRGGRLTPREVRVPAFIAIRVILRATDAGRDQGYTLQIAGNRMAVGHERSLDELELDGLLPGEAYVGRGPQGNVRIVASAEPGP